MRALIGMTIAAVLASSHGLSAATRPCGQVEPCPAVTVEGPIPFDSPAGPPHDPTARNGQSGYIAAEYFISGRANVFNYDRQPARTNVPPGSGLVVRYPDLPYKTRVYVWGPTNPNRFSGDVVIEFLNSSAGFDSAPQWLISHDYFARAGMAYIAVTTSASTSIPFLKAGCHSIGPSCGSRYASLMMTDNGQEYEIVSQLVTALKRQTGKARPLPAGYPTVRRVYVTGQSQQAGSVITHANQFSFPLVDGYFVASNDRARTLGGLSKPSDLCGGTDAQPYPNCFATLPAGKDNVRTDLPMPVYHLMTETDVIESPRFFSGVLHRQADKDTSPRASYRLVEIPAVAHNVDVEIEIVPGIRLKDLCADDAYGIKGPIDGYEIVDAMWRNMRRQVIEGKIPPRAPRIRTTPDHQIVRDQYGNARGGVRMPELEHPTNSYFYPFNTGKPGCPAGTSSPECAPAFLAPFTGLVCFLSGSYRPFSPDQLRALYPTHHDYVVGIAQSARALYRAGFLEPGLVKKHIIEADRSSIGR